MRDTVAQCVIQRGSRTWEVPALPSTREAAMKLLGDCTREHDDLGAYRFVELIDDPEFGGVDLTRYCFNRYAHNQWYLSETFSPSSPTAFPMVRDDILHFAAHILNLVSDNPNSFTLGGNADSDPAQANYLWFSTNNVQGNHIASLAIRINKDRISIPFPSDLRDLNGLEVTMPNLRSALLAVEILVDKWSGQRQVFLQTPTVNHCLPDVIA